MKLVVVVCFVMAAIICATPVRDRRQEGIARLNTDDPTSALPVRDAVDLGDKFAGVEESGRRSKRDSGEPSEDIDAINEQTENTERTKREHAPHKSDHPKHPKQPKHSNHKPGQHSGYKAMNQKVKRSAKKLVTKKKKMPKVRSTTTYKSVDDTTLKYTTPTSVWGGFKDISDWF